MRRCTPIFNLIAFGGLWIALIAPGCGEAFDNGCWDTLTCSQGAEAGMGGEDASGGTSPTSGGTATGGGSGGGSTSGGDAGGGSPADGGVGGQGNDDGGKSSGGTSPEPTAGAAGAGGSCNTNEPCDPVNPCKYGHKVCRAGGETCEETMNRPPGSWCGAAQQCSAGVLTAPDACDAAGKCVKGKTTACTPFSCNSTGDDCDSTRTVPCGSSMCTAQSQHCCYFSSSKLGVCLAPEQDCEGYPDLITLRCKVKADCNQGEVCCGIFANYSTELSCMDPKLCAPNGLPVSAIQFCDPKSQSECELGSCVPFNNSTQFPAYISYFPQNFFACATK